MQDIEEFKTKLHKTGTVFDKSDFVWIHTASYWKLFNINSDRDCGSQVVFVNDFGHAQSVGYTATYSYKNNNRDNTNPAFHSLQDAKRRVLRGVLAELNKVSDDTSEKLRPQISRIIAEYFPKNPNPKPYKKGDKYTKEDFFWRFEGDGHYLYNNYCINDTPAKKDNIIAVAKNYRYSVDFAIYVSSMMQISGAWHSISAAGAHEIYEVVIEELVEFLNK